MALWPIFETGVGRDEGVELHHVQHFFPLRCMQRDICRQRTQRFPSKNR